MRHAERHSGPLIRHDRWIPLAVVVLPLWAVGSHPLLAEAQRLDIALVAGALLGTLAMCLVVERSREFREHRHWRRAGGFRRVGSALLLLFGSFVGVLIGVGVFYGVNGIRDGGPSTLISYAVVQGPVSGRRSSTWVRLRSLDGRDHSVTLFVQARPEPSWVGDIVVLEVKPGRLGEPWVAGYEHYPARSPEGEPAPVSGGYCLPAYEWLKGPCPPP